MDRTIISHVRKMISNFPVKRTEEIEVVLGLQMYQMLCNELGRKVRKIDGVKIRVV